MPEPESSSPTARRRRGGSVVGLLQQQRMLVDELADLADGQADLVRRCETDALLGLLTRRQRIIERFAAAQEILGELTGDGELGEEAVDDVQRGQIRALIGDIGARLAEVMERDAADQRELEAARHEAARELSALDAARQARDAYRGAGRARNRFADQRG